ncbi:ABC transporter substrate-binding protein [uncultured Amnibacterium sp.]|uniref:ABC transporter substrate-binding protein n=1 Tax=uncultured Amnibacterium sp. TaxID=1631851 RepID=UPI0035CC0995
MTVNNPQMKDMESLKGEFEKTHPNISVNFIQMEENDLRAAVTKDIASGGGQYDVITIGAYETPIWAKNGWLTDLTQKASSDAKYDVDDIIPAVRKGLTVDDKLWAVPFYGESSFLMYNKDLFKAAGITAVEHPTWDQVESWAAKLKTKDTAGICLRGKPGWGEMGGPLTGTLQTSGSGWFDKDWTSQVNTPKFKEAVSRYVRVLKNSGESDPASFGFTECLNLFSQGKAAMWYDATVAAATLESPDSSKVVGKIGYVHAPTVESKESGWLWSWNLAVPDSSKKKDAAWAFLDWATSKDYLNLVGTKLGWAKVPPGSRTSTYANADYLKAAGDFAPITKEVMESINSTQFGPLSQPTPGYFPATPGWPEFGNDFTQGVADVLAGRSTVDQLVAKFQPIAQKVGDDSKK